MGSKELQHRGAPFFFGILAIGISSWGLNNAIINPPTAASQTAAPFSGFDLDVEVQSVEAISSQLRKTLELKFDPTVLRSEQSGLDRVAKAELLFLEYSEAMRFYLDPSKEHFVAYLTTRGMSPPASLQDGSFSERSWDRAVRSMQKARIESASMYVHVPVFYNSWRERTDLRRRSSCARPDRHVSTFDAVRRNMEVVEIRTMTELQSFDGEHYAAWFGVLLAWDPEANPNGDPKPGRWVVVELVVYDAPPDVWVAFPPM